MAQNNFRGEVVARGLDQRLDRPLPQAARLAEVRDLELKAIADNTVGGARAAFVDRDYNGA